MHLFTIVTLLLTASSVVAVPMTHGFKHDPTDNPTWKYDKRPGSTKTAKEEGEGAPGRVAKIDDAMTLANQKIESMHGFLQKHPEDEKLKATPQWKDSFGPHADAQAVRTTVSKLRTDQIRINSADAEHADRAAKRVHQGVNGFTRPKSDRMGSIHLGTGFYRGDSEEARHHRAGTLIHEATHQLSRTGDHANPTTDKIIKGGFPIPANPKNSYVNSPDFPGLLKNSENMHLNADSFRKFAEQCHGAVRRRALLEDDPVAYYLAKRSACALPKDYFDKKIAANKAAAKGTKALTTKGKAGGAKVHKVGKGTPTKAAKGVHKVGKGTGTKGANAKVAKGAKGAKSAVGANKGKAAKGTKSAAGANKGKAAKGAKGAKSTAGANKGKAAKGAKFASGANKGKAAKGSKPAARANKGKAGNAGNAAKATASKGAKSTSSKGKQSALSPKRGQGVTKSASKAASLPKAGKVGKVAQVATKAAPVVAKAAAAPKKKKN